MPYLIFTIYLLAAGFILYHSSLLRRSGLSVKYWIFFFIIKTCIGCYYGYWYGSPARIGGSDTWRFHFQALEEYHTLSKDPAGYLSELFHNSYASWGGLLSTDSYWNDLKDNLMIKTVALMHVMSGGHYYVNVVIFSFLTLFGFVFFYEACGNLLRRRPGLITTAIILFTPSCLFWTSGLHRDGFMLLFAGMFFWRLTVLQRRATMRWRDPAWLVFAFAGVFIFRNYVAILLLPVLIAWVITVKLKARPVLVFPAMGLLSIVLTFLIPWPDLPAKLIERKTAFEKLSGQSALPPIQLLPTFSSFAKNLPVAIERSMLRPYPWEHGSILEKLAALEIVAIMVVCLASFWYRKKSASADIRRFQWMITLFCLGIFILIGYTVPFMGAIVRYRAMFLMLFTAVISINFEFSHIFYFNLLNNELKSKKIKRE